MAASFIFVRFWHLASIRTDPPNGRYWGHSGHWPELALIDSVANGGLIVLPGPITINHRELVIALAARHHLPAAYAYRFFVASGGLVSYGADPFDQSRQAAAYVDRILKGAKPEDLPVQQPTKYELAINLKTAKTLGLTVPPTLLARADEVIE